MYVVVACTIILWTRVIAEDPSQSNHVHIIDTDDSSWKFSTNSTSEEAPCFTETYCGPVEGRLNNGVHIFKGIPYAKPPIGQLRWKPPVPLTNGDGCWKGTLKALEFSKWCFQDQPVLGRVGDEDCLYLNIYTPSLDLSAKLPVMVWIHGGYMMFSSAAEVGYHPHEKTVQQTGMVYVTFNYRLNAFGFLALNLLSERSITNTSGNYGFMDQILVLEWVQRNIRYFGGDPDLVTIFGQSSGGTSVWAMMVSPLAKGLFHRAWMSSSSSVFNATLEQAEKDNLVFLHRSNCSDAECLYSLTPSQVMDAVPIDIYPYWVPADACDLPTKGLLYGPICIVDGLVVPNAPLEIWQQGKGNDVPLIIGSTAQEVDFLPSDMTIRSWDWDEYTKQVTDYNGGLQVIDMVTNYTMLLKFEKQLAYVFRCC